MIKNKKEIETETGLKFDWKGLPDKKGCRIITTKKVIFSNRAEWQSQFDWLIDTMLKMKKTFKKYLK